MITFLRTIVLPQVYAHYKQEIAFQGIFRSKKGCASCSPGDGNWQPFLSTTSQLRVFVFPFSLTEFSLSTMVYVFV